MNLLNVIFFTVFLFFVLFPGHLFDWVELLCEMCVELDCFCCICCACEEKVHVNGLDFVTFSKSLTWGRHESLSGWTWSSIHVLPVCVWQGRQKTNKQTRNKNAITYPELRITAGKVFHAHCLDQTKPKSQGSCPGRKDVKAAKTFEGKADKHSTFKGNRERPAV